MGNKRNKCCCEGCPDICWTHGEAHSPCTATQTALFYFSGPIRGFEGDCNYPDPVLTRQPLACIWSQTVSTGVGTSVDWELEIFSDTDAEIRLIDGANTYIWIPVEQIPLADQVCPKFDRDYSPLCTSIFQLDVVNSDTPPCTLPTCLCVTLANACCDSTSHRAEPMPATLFANLQYCCGVNGSPESPLLLDFTLTWSPADNAWVGSTAACDGTLSVKLFCICGIDDGCGGPSPQHCYEIEWEHTGCANVGPMVSVGGSCLCDPFSVDFVLSEGNLCCPVENTMEWILTVTE